MRTTTFKKIIATLCLITLIIILKTFAGTKGDEPSKPTNLKVLPKDISHDDLIATMKMFSKSLGVKCGECHVKLPNSPEDHPEFNFASDEKPEKLMARKMYKMMTAINKKYLAKMDEEGKVDQISCVTCHRGSTKPMVTVDSLPQQGKH